MIRRIKVDTFLDELGQGISNPVRVIGSDYNQYILKNQRSDSIDHKSKFNCMFVNELLAYQIGAFLGVPIPEAVIAYLENTLIDADPTIRFAYKFSEGTFYASKELQNVENNLMENIGTLVRMGKPYMIRSWNTFLDNIVNKGDIARVLAFDLLIANFDRYGNEGNILIDNTDGQRKFYAIDHGHAFFGSEWNQSKMDTLKAAGCNEEYVEGCIGLMFKNNKGYADGLGTIFNALESHIDLSDVSNHSFQDIVSEIEIITEDHLDYWLSNIPDEWFINKPVQVGYLKKYLLEQRSVVRHFIQRLANRRAFSNYRGGILEWKTIEKNVGTVL